MYRIAGYYHDIECDRLTAEKRYDLSSPAVKWFERSGKAGYGHALEFLGDLCHLGILKDSRPWCELDFYGEAAEKGSVTAWLKMYKFRKSMGMFGAAIEDLRKAIMCGVTEDYCQP